MHSDVNPDERRDIMLLIEMKKKHAYFIVESAIKLYGCTVLNDDMKNNWVNYLMAGGSINLILKDIKFQELNNKKNKSLSHYCSNSNEVNELEVEKGLDIFSIKAIDKIKSLMKD
jgi:hypothetical protein